MKMHPTGRWLWTAAALLAGLVLRLWFIGHFARIAGDTLVYGEIAKNWMQYGVYGFVDIGGAPQPTLIRLPGYPLFLIACFRIFGVEQYTAVMDLQAIIDLLSCILISALAGRLFGDRARMAALWLSALCPFTASYVAAPLTETLTLNCIVVTFYALQRWQQARSGFNRWLWVVIAALAYAILLRPEQGLLAAAVIPSMLWIAVSASGCPLFTAPSSQQAGVPGEQSCLIERKSGVFAPRAICPHSTRHRLRATLPVLVAALLTLLPLLPWTIRNERTFHVFQPLAPRKAVDPGEFVPLGFQRWFRTWAIDFAATDDVYWNYDGTPIKISDLPTRAFDTEVQYSRTGALLNDYNETSNATPALDIRFAALAHERICANPARYYIALPIARLIDMALRPRVEMFSTPLAWWKYHEDPPQTIFAAAYAALNLAYFVLAAQGIVLWRRRHWTGNTPLAWAMLSSILLRSALLLTLDNAEPRYTLEFFPILFFLASIPFTRFNRTTSSPKAANPIS